MAAGVGFAVDPERLLWTPGHTVGWTPVQFKEAIDELSYARLHGLPPPAWRRLNEGISPVRYSSRYVGPEFLDRARDLKALYSDRRTFDELVPELK